MPPMRGDVLEGLNERQREAVTAPDGPTLVLAGAGSGKTRVIAHRIAYLLTHRSLPPASILAVTFTNKAADEMRRRVEELLGARADELWVHTFHALCLRLLRRFGEDVGLRAGFVVYGEEDRRSLLRRICRDLELAEREFPLSRVASALSRYRESAVGGSADAFGPLARVMPALAERYVKELRSAGAVDFDDLLLLGLELLTRSERARAFAERRFEAVLVDEYQDTNRVQYRLLRLLAPKGNLFVVGDEDQAIYNFRGADLRNILDFERDFPLARVVKLEVNYRSTGAILRAAGGVIRHNRDRKGKNLVASGSEGERARLREHEDEHEEAAAIAVAVQEMQRERPSPTAAVLLRAHSQSRVLEEELVLKNVPHRVVGGLRFYARREIQDALAYVRLAVRPDDDASFLRVVNVPPRGLGDATVASLSARARELGVSLFEASVRLLDDDALGGRARQGLSRFVSLVTTLSTRAAVLSPSSLLRLVLEESDLLRGYGPSEAASPSSRDRAENLDQLVAAAAEHEERHEASISGFLDSVSLLGDADAVSGDSPCLIMTVHAAKGLEFDVVFLPGLEEGLFPHVRSSGDRRALEEERRLFYVGLTRARKKLFLSCARTRRSSYQGGGRSPSRFLSEIPADAITSSGALSGGPARGQESSSRGLRPGARVRHGTFGEGRVVDASGSGRDRKVTVIFARAGRKRLMAQFANLEVLS
jgi:DNA helicase-2/ATP-dependent DNA helicase PcrA